jgi:hypothetical protein
VFYNVGAGSREAVGTFFCAKNGYRYTNTPKTRQFQHKKIANQLFMSQLAI